MVRLCGIDAMGLVEVMVSCLDVHIQQFRSALPQSPSDSGVVDAIAVGLLVLAANGRACRRHEIRCSIQLL